MSDVSSPLPLPSKSERLLYICDWLPPDYGAVGQYALLFAQKVASEGRDIVVAGLSSREDSSTSADIGAGHLRQIRVKVPTYDKTSLLKRMLWTLRTNTQLVWKLRRQLLEADVIQFTGSPPYFLHWIAPLNLLLRKKLVYRITDFHPECLMAQRKRPSSILKLIYRLTVFWRRRVDEFEVLGIDQLERLKEIGIPSEKIRVQRDRAPVEFNSGIMPLDRPPAVGGKLALLYSGNWGIAHDYRTFVSAYDLHHKKGSGRFVLWVNAVGAAVESIENELRHLRLPYGRTSPVPLESLSRLLITPDAHLITLSDAFVGFVLPSKVYGCIESGLPILYVGSARSDVHRLCVERTRAGYFRVEVGSVQDCWDALERLADTKEQK